MPVHHLVVGLGTTGGECVAALRRCLDEEARGFASADVRYVLPLDPGESSAGLRRRGASRFAAVAAKFAHQLRRASAEIGLSEDLDLHIFCGLAGGSGSGSLPRAIAACRDCLGNRSLRLFVYGILPGERSWPLEGSASGEPVEVGLLRRHANVYAALQELKAQGEGAWTPFGTATYCSRPIDSCFVFHDPSLFGVADWDMASPVASFARERIAGSRNWEFGTWVRTDGLREQVRLNDSRLMLDAALLPVEEEEGWGSAEAFWETVGSGAMNTAGTREFPLQMGVLHESFREAFASGYRSGGVEEFYARMLRGRLDWHAREIRRRIEDVLRGRWRASPGRAVLAMLVHELLLALEEWRCLHAKRAEQCARKAAAASSDIAANNHRYAHMGLLGRLFGRHRRWLRENQRKNCEKYSSLTEEAGHSYAAELLTRVAGEMERLRPEIERAAGRFCTELLFGAGLPSALAVRLSYARQCYRRLLDESREDELHSEPGLQNLPDLFPQNGLGAAWGIGERSPYGTESISL